MDAEEDTEVQADIDMGEQADTPPTGSGSSGEQNAKRGERLKYNVDDRPPLHVNLLLGFQLLGYTISSPVLIVYILHSNLCAGHNNLVFAELLSTSLFQMGVCTLLQVTIGIRLPIIQGSAFAYLMPILAMMGTSSWKCPPTCSKDYESGNITTTQNDTMCDDEAWRPRLLEISGGLMCASVVHCAIGLTGIMGVLRKYIGPLTIVPAVALIGLSIYPSVTRAAQHHWGIAFLTLAFYVLCALYLSRFDVPVPVWSSEKAFHSVRFPVFKLFSVLLTLIFGWLLCLIFTVTGSLATNPDHVTYAARVDARIDVIYSTKWIFVPYPGYWGTPTVSPGVFVGMVAAVLQSVIESISDYYTTAAVCDLPAPPKHAINRGIAIEGLGSFLSGLLGNCHGTTSYSQIVGVVEITGVASRFTFQIAGVLFIISGLFGKFGGALTMCPDPVIGALSMMSFGMLTSVALSTFRHCDVTSTRNKAILGLALMLGLGIPSYMAEHPDVMQTGSPSLDQVLTVFLRSGMLVGAVVGFFLDNVIPGTESERGLKALNSSHRNVSTGDGSCDARVYDLPYVSNWLRRHRIFSYMPFLPSYMDRSCRSRCCRRSTNSKGIRREEISVERRLNAP